MKITDRISANFGSLRSRLIISVAIIQAGLMAVFLIDSISRQRVMILDNKSKEGIALAEALSVTASSWLASNDVAGLQELLDAQSQYPELIFGVLTDEFGQIKAHTDRSKIGLYVLDLPQNPKQTIIGKTSDLFDIAVPSLLSGKLVGWVRIGIGQKRVSEQLNNITVNGIIYGSVAMLAGSYIVWLLGSYITRRLYAVQNSINQVASGNTSARANITGNDEAAIIAREFDNMLDAQEKSGIELQKNIKALEDYKFALDQSAIITISDHNGLIISANDNFCNISKYTREELVGKTLKIINSGFHPTSFFKDMWKTIKSGKVWSGEIRNRKKDGEFYWVNSTIIPFLDTDNKPFQYLSIRYDITEKKKTEEEIIKAKEKVEENETRLKLAAASGKLGIWEWNINKNVLTWDDRMYELYGITDKTNSNNLENWTNGLHPEDMEKAVEEVSTVLKGEKSFDSLFRIVQPNGKIVQIKADGLIIKDVHGNPLRMIGINRDITQQKQAEDALRDNELKYRTLFETSDDAILLFSQNHCEDCNAGALKAFGCTREQIIGVHSKRFSPSLQPDGKSSEQEMTRKSKLVFEGEPQFFEWEFCQAHGSTFAAEVFLNRLDLDGKPYMQAIVRDISIRKKAEEQLALSALIVNSSEDAIISKTIDGTITSWNHGAEKVLGYSAGEAIGKSIYMLISPELHDEEIMISENIKKGKSIDHLETCRIRKDGSIINVSLTISPILAESGKVIGASKIMRDISDQKSMEFERNKIMKELIQRNRDLEQFSYIVSHNLRAPVANIMGISDFLLKPELNPAKKEQLNSGLSKSVNALDVVIKDLNQILQSRREISEQNTKVKFSELLNAIKLSIANLIKKEQVDFVVDFSEVDEMMTLKSYLYSVFYNLVSNSIKYKQPSIDPVIVVRSRLTENGIEIIFRDNGLGIDLENNSEHVFGLYKRFHSHTEGKGMGLYMVKTQVETLGGKISVKSEVNKGTEFKIEFEYLKK